MKRLALLFLACLLVNGAASADSHKPNIIFILADDLGYGDVGVFFQNSRKEANSRHEPWHLTPKLDEMAAEGIQLRHHYCPAPVCAPSRASLLTGVHQGHANVRDNQFDKALENNHTLATVLKGAGYATAAIGKWGLQGAAQPAPPQWPAHPLRRGFDFYYGYMRHNDGHAHYPKEDGKEVWEGMTNVSAQLDGCYTTDLFTARAKKWIVDQRSANPEQPFFLYLAYDTPHAKLELPPCEFPAGGGLTGGLQWLGNAGRMITTADGIPDTYIHPGYASATWDHDGDPATPEVAWPNVYQRYATDVRRIDDCVADLQQLLKDLAIDRDTLVVFTTDNGPSRESYLPEDYEPNFFNSFGPFDGIKRDVWEGGIRVGAIARWPARIQGGSVSDSPSQFHDWMPTFAEMAGIPAPARTDGVSLIPTLTGQGTQKPSTVYVEYFEGGKTPKYEEFAPAHRGRDRKQMQALRLGDFIGVRYRVQNHVDPFEIYNVVSDPKELTNLASSRPDLQAAMHDAVLQLRRPGAGVKRPYDDVAVPALTQSQPSAAIEWRTFIRPMPWVAKMDDMPAETAGKCAKLDEVPALPANTTAVMVTGTIEIAADGDFAFTLPAGAKALLRVHDASVIDAGFAGTEIEPRGNIRLAAGRHPFRLYALTDLAHPELPRLNWNKTDASGEK